jgi:Chitinase class I
VAAYSKTTAGGTPPTPSEDTYNDFIKYATSGLGLNEQVMLLSNVIWETGGLQYLTESGCSSGTCSYGNYYGRGYLQLTWQDNYSSASTSLFSSDTLVNDPDQVASNPVAWQTASWYWSTFVHSYITDTVLSSYDLGVSIKQINGSVECTSPCQNQPKNRLTIYNSCLATVGISGTGSISSCCS